MELTIYSKNMTTKEGRQFNTYSTHLVNRETGEEIYHKVKFRESCGAPSGCPCNIIVEKANCNISHPKYTRSDGSVGLDNVLWINDWKAGSEYVDHSTDEYF